jgi:hypothetical protein
LKGLETRRQIRCPLITYVKLLQNGTAGQHAELTHLLQELHVLVVVVGAVLFERSDEGVETRLDTAD